MITIFTIIFFISLIGALLILLFQTIEINKVENLPVYKNRFEKLILLIISLGHHSRKKVLPITRDAIHKTGAFLKKKGASLEQYASRNNKHREHPIDASIQKEKQLYKIDMSLKKDSE